MTSGSIFFKLPFLDPHIFYLTIRIFDDTYTFSGGTDEPPYYILGSL